VVVLFDGDLCREVELNRGVGSYSRDTEAGAVPV
jgi:hypothetical protein